MFIYRRANPEQWPTSDPFALSPNSCWLMAYDLDLKEDDIDMNELPEVRALAVISLNGIKT